MKKGCTLNIVIFVLGIHMHSQTPQIIWEHSYGGSGGDGVYDIEQTADNGFIICGGSTSDDFDVELNQGYSDYWIVKFDSNYEIQWQKSFGGTSFDAGKSVIQTNDGGYFVAGDISSDDGDILLNHGGRDFWVLKLTVEGNLIWQKSYGGPGGEYLNHTIRIEDSGYLMAGECSGNGGDVSGVHGNEDAWIVRVDNAGELIWQKPYGGSDDDIFYSCILLQEGGYLFAGVSHSDDGDVTYNQGDGDFWLVKTDSSGSIEWQKTYGGSSIDKAFSVVQYYDGGYLAVGETGSTDGDISEWYPGTYHDIWLIKIDSIGNLEWEKTLGGSGGQEGQVVISIIDSNILVGGYSTSDDFDVSFNHGEGDYWIVYLDSLGNIIWEKSLGGSTSDHSDDIIVQSPSEFVICGYSTSHDGDVSLNYGGSDVWIVKLGYCTNHYYADADADGYGNLLMDSIACNLPAGYVLDSTDCDDSNNLIHPLIEDICNAIDDNCNESIDEDSDFTHWFIDTDEDGFGDFAVDSVSCFLLAGYVIDSTDCNDADELIHPFTEDICNSIDDNCNLLIDEDADFIHWFIDADEDGFGDLLNDSLSCFTLIGYVVDSTDCNDANNQIYPGSEEICNNLDDDCDGFADENLDFNLYFADADADNFGNEIIDSLWCLLPDGFVADSTDCDDTNPFIYPGATEVLNGLDDDCDDATDEGLSINNQQFQIQIYPNPADEFLRIEFENTQIEKLEIKSASGELIYTTDHIISNHITISTKNFSAGMYFISIQHNNSVYFASFVVE